MEPLSAGTGGEAYVLRVPCVLQERFGIDSEGPLNFTLDGVSCISDASGDTLVVSASGFATAAEARSFFPTVQRALVHLLLADQASLLIPEKVIDALAQPAGTRRGFLPGDTRCAAKGWPAEHIFPLLVNDVQGDAWVYPDHLYVAVMKSEWAMSTFFTEHARLNFALQSAGGGRADKALPAVLVHSAEFYAHASRSFNQVQGLLAAVTALEGLGDPPAVTAATSQAVERLCEEAQKIADLDNEVDGDTILGKLRDVTRGGQRAKFRDLLERYPDADLSASGPAQYRRLVNATYDVRSHYVHSSLQPSPFKGFAFEQIRALAVNGLKRVVQAKIEEFSSVPQPLPGRDLDDEAVAS